MSICISKAVLHLKFTKFHENSRSLKGLNIPYLQFVKSFRLLCMKMAKSICSLDDYYSIKKLKSILFKDTTTIVSHKLLPSSFGATQTSTIRKEYTRELDQNFPFQILISLPLLASVDALLTNIFL